MAFVYIVRCRFTDPEKEQVWNDWYSGPKITQMLAKPYFRSCQRFRLEAGLGRQYLALWTLTSPDAFKTKEYTSDWGFFDWSPFITDWSRDLFDGGDASEIAFAAPANGALDIVSFDGMPAPEANAARDRVAPAYPGMLWLPVIGLDRHTPLIGVSPRPDRSTGQIKPTDGATNIQKAVYRPICEQYTAN